MTTKDRADRCSRARDLLLMFQLLQRSHGRVRGEGLDVAYAPAHMDESDEEVEPRAQDNNRVTLVAVQILKKTTKVTTARS